MNKTTAQISSRNEAVKTAYFAVLKLAKRMLSTIEREELRFTLTREEKPLKGYGLIQEFCSPLLYLRLECLKDSTLGIRYGFEPGQDYAHISIAFTRSLYKLTMEIATTNKPDDPIKLDWYIHNPDDLYCYLEEQNKHHTFKLIPYKQSANRRKQMKAVA